MYVCCQNVTSVFYFSFKFWPLFKMPFLPSGAIASIGLVQNPDFRAMGNL